MTSEEYREKLNNQFARLHLRQIMSSINRNNLFNDLYKTLEDVDFAKNATIKDLHNLSFQLFQIQGLFNEAAKTIKESGLSLVNEFDDQKMELSDIGIVKNKQYTCKKDFVDTFSNLNILKGTIIKVTDLIFRKDESKIIVFYLKLKTDSKSEKMIEIFEKGKQSTLIDLELFGKNFKE